jgi:hypothetical protein
MIGSAVVLYVTGKVATHVARYTQYPGYEAQGEGTLLEHSVDNVYGNCIQFCGPRAFSGSVFHQ